MIDPDAAIPDEGRPPAPSPILAWVERAKSGERFDLYCAGREAESTRARHDGVQLSLAHFVGSSPVAVLHLREGPDGQWRARSDAPWTGSQASMAMAWAGLDDALARLAPAQACGIGRRILARM